MSKVNKPYGLVLCGGNSTRMGTDKSKLIYYNKPQSYYLYEMLNKVCDDAFLSCNSSQANEISKDFKTLVDMQCYENIGPMAALLTAFKKYPSYDFLVVGCDYPFVKEKDLEKFLISLNKEKAAAAFYNVEYQLYEPLLAWYSADAANVLVRLFQEKKYSLQSFLKLIDAQKYFPADTKVIKSVDTPETFKSALTILKQQY